MKGIKGEDGLLMVLKWLCRYHFVSYAPLL